MSGTVAQDPEKLHSAEETPNALEKFQQDESYDERNKQSILVQFTDAEIKRTWRKVDLHVLPVAVLLYLSSYIDRYAHRPCCSSGLLIAPLLVGPTSEMRRSWAWLHL
jgi:hypothetical protein